MPTIRVQEETFKRLQAWAEPLRGSSDQTVRRVLDAAEEKGRRMPGRDALVRMIRGFRGGVLAARRGEPVRLGTARSLADHILERVGSERSGG